MVCVNRRDAVEFLHKLDPAVALATACSVEQILAIDWEAEQEEIRRRGDPRRVMCISRIRVRELDAALASLPHGVHPDPAAECHLLQIVKDLPPDRAWWVAHLVVRYQAGPTPDAVRRATARAESYYRQPEK